jgi:hypothetical protein
MTIAENPIRQERLSELVTQLSGAPLDRSRAAVADAAHAGDDRDSLRRVARALVTIQTEAA